MEISYPVLDKPEFPKVPYDQRNLEKAGHYKGIGETGKVGHMGSSKDKYAMPPGSHIMGVPRDHEG